MKHWTFLVLAFLFLIITGCSKEVPHAVITTQAPQTATPWVVPAPNEGNGQIKGIFIGEDGEIIVNSTAYLSRNLTAGQNEIPPTISFSASSDIRAIVNVNTGEFYFNNVIPAENYVITILNGPGKIIVVREVNSETPLVIKIDADQILDLGEIVILEN